MKIFVKVKPGAKEKKIKKIDKSHFIISVKEPPIKGAANKAVVEAFADYFGVSRSEVQIISGFTSRQKIIEIYE
jgi:hypothetical protein